MAQFPELEPNTRSYDFGLFSLTEEPSLSAGIVRFRHSVMPQSCRLVLGYNAITDAQATLVRNHYQGQAGSFLSFSLPSIIWEGHTFSGNVAPYDMLWRYAETPVEEHLQIGHVNVTVSLISDGAADPDFEVAASIAAGIATGA